MKLGSHAQFALYPVRSHELKIGLSVLFHAGNFSKSTLKSVAASLASARPESLLLAMDSESSSGDDIALDGDSFKSFISLPMLSRDDLRAIALFESLGDQQLDTILERQRESVHQADQVIVMEQDWGESLFLLCDGLAKVRTYTSDGDEVVMSLLGSGDVFGEMAVFDGDSRSADVVALTPLRLVKLRIPPFAALLEKNTGLGVSLAKLEATRLRDLNRRFALQTADATTRLLDALAYLARKSSSTDDPQAPIPDLTQQEIALIAGLARETASRALSKLRSRGTVTEENGMLSLVDLKPLQKRGLIP